jgi:uncharacterized protein (TIGR03083 family)
MPDHEAVCALRAESAALAAVLADLTSADFDLPSPCPPWTLGDLTCHVIIGAGRIAQALAEPEDDDIGALVSTTGYFRRDDRFSAAVNADRIEIARNLAARLGSADAIRGALSRTCTEAIGLLMQAPPGRIVRTRHGDKMLLTDFARTRVVELGLHGLDLAIGLGRPPWLTDQTAAVVEDLLLPEGGADGLRAQLGCDRVGLIARLTGRVTLSAAEETALARAGVVHLALG